MLSRRRFVAGLAAGLGAVVAACTSGAASILPTLRPAGSPTPSPAPAASASEAPTPTSGPTGSSIAVLRRKIGRMLVVGFRGTTLAPSDPFLTAIAAGELGGVILFDRDGGTGKPPRNITAPAQLAALTTTLRAAALHGPIGAELLIAVDQEGGRVARLNPGNGFPASESAADLGAKNDIAHTSDAATLTAITLAGAGINVNLAPVVDLNLNPANPAIGALGRSYSADADIVVANATAVIRAEQGAGILMAIKHFPGEGSATGNTDKGVVDVTASWTDIELDPFRQLIAAGVPDAVMVGHIVNDQLDPGQPASLSRPTISDLLRDQLGWDGVVISDDLQAAAITLAYGEAEAIALSIEAGTDLLLFANQAGYDGLIVEHVIEHVLGFVAEGRISEARLDESIARIKRLFPTVD